MLSKRLPQSVKGKSVCTSPVLPGLLQVVTHVCGDHTDFETRGRTMFSISAQEEHNVFYGPVGRLYFTTTYYFYKKLEERSVYAPNTKK